MLEDFEIRKSLREMQGTTGGRSTEDMDLIKMSLSASMYHIGEQMYSRLKEGGDPFIDEPHIVEVLKDISALINEILIFEY